MPKKSAEKRDLRPTLVFLTGEQLSVSVPLDKDDVTIGRALEADVRINDSKTARVHARIRSKVDPKTGEVVCTVYDLESKTGTFVNGEQVSRRVLSVGDKIGIGRQIVKFELLDEVDREYHRQIQRMLSHDELTGLLGSRSFFVELRREVARAKAEDRGLCVLMLDVDFFKDVNDKHGHLTGSRTLEELGAVINRALRSGDAACRFGGEEFAAFLLDAELPQALVAAERIRSEVEKTEFTVIKHGQAGGTHNITISIGIANYPTDSVDPIELVEFADMALYRAKREGRNRIRAYREPTAEELARPLAPRRD
jgi:diguanylate cyclase (GGDEF)-like protein